jgi:hypothetical protein
MEYVVAAGPPEQMDPSLCAEYVQEALRSDKEINASWPSSLSGAS